MSVSIYCPHCHKHTALSCAEVEHENAYHQRCVVNAIWEASRDHQWWIGICNGCGRPVLVHGVGDIVYPHPLPAPSDENIPKDLRADLDESKMCFSVGCFRACAVLARRCIQNTCMVKGAKSKDLVDQIKELTKAGIITTDIEEWATVVRWIGNDAAHPGKDPVTKEDAEDCLKLAEQFLHVIFVTTEIAKARRAKRGK